MVATKHTLTGGKHKKHHKKSHKKKVHAKKAMKKHVRVSVPKRAKYVKPGSKAVAKDPLRKCGPKIKSGKHAGLCKVVLSKRGSTMRARQLSKKK
jgi:hypothetical protein